MERISRLDQVLLLLRKQIKQRAGAALVRPGASAAGTGARTGAADGDPIARVGVRLAQLRATGVTDRRVLARALIEQILVQHFGEALLNEAAFQGMLDRVLACVDEDPELGAVVMQLTALP